MRKFFDVLNESEKTDEATTLSPVPYIGDGTGITGDDDYPPGTTVFGTKMLPVEVPNRLTGKTIKYVPAADLDHEWNYDEFANSQSMGSIFSYSQTLDDLDGMLGGRLFQHTDRRKFRLQQDKWIARSQDQAGFGVSQTKKLRDDKVETKEPKVDITEKIHQFIGDTEPEMVNEMVVDAMDRRMLAQSIMKGKNAKIKIKSLGVEATVTNYDDEIVISYPKNEDFTLSLVDIADSLGMSFKLTKDGGKQAFRMIK